VVCVVCVVCVRGGEGGGGGGGDLPPRLRSLAFHFTTTFHPDKADVSAFIYFWAGHRPSLDQK
jgi:hypothetical protein